MKPIPDTPAERLFFLAGSLSSIHIISAISYEESIFFLIHIIFAIIALTLPTVWCVINKVGRVAFGMFLLFQALMGIAIAQTNPLMRDSDNSIIVGLSAILGILYLLILASLFPLDVKRVDHRCKTGGE